MKYCIKPRFIFLFCFLSLSLLACDSNQLQAPKPPAYIKPVPTDWLTYQKQQTERKTEFTQNNSIAYDWFSDFPFSETDGVPYIMLKLLPVISPENWGSEDNFLDAVGLFKDERMPGYPVARGIGFSAQSRGANHINIDYASFTCAACHIGRVKKDDGKIEYLDGGVNAEFNIVQYRVRVFKTIQAIIGTEDNENRQAELAIKAFLSALDKTHQKNPVYFYQNYNNGRLKLDAAYEKQQIALFKKQAVKVIPKFIQRAIAEYKGYGALLEKNYGTYVKESLEGFPGMADATGISTENGYIAAQKSFLGRLFAQFFLPPAPGITDFMTVWEQDKRKAQWDESHSTLINGGGQWNGNIPIPIYRNLAAQLTLGLENNDIRVSAFAVELLDGLPASVYPFDVDIKLAKKGQILFKENCAQCHQPHNGKVYTDLGTNLDRSYVVNYLTRKAAIKGFSEICNPDTEVDMAGVQQKPCAKFDGISLVGKDDVIMSPNNQHHGYNARPLSGVWAQAPYLHNGSVPTMYHLLIPSERPDKFIKSQLEYDKEKMGFKWHEKDSEKYSKGYVFNTKVIAPFSNKGHDKDIKEENHRYKLDWSNDKPGAMAIIEYLKTL